MPSGAVLAIVIICLLIALAAGAAVALEVRTMTARRQFGPEYDQLAGRLGHRRARAELIARKRRVAKLNLAPLPADRRSHYSAEWATAQEQFVDDPARAVSTAAKLVLGVAKERGYQADDQERLLTDLSVTHPRRLASYRRAEETAANAESASTEDLRQALLWYRAMFRDLADTVLADTVPSSTGPSSTGPSSTGPSSTGPSSTGPASAKRARGGDAGTGKQGHPAAALRGLAPSFPRPAIRRPAQGRPARGRPAGQRPAERAAAQRAQQVRALQLRTPALRRPSWRLRRPRLALPRLPRLRRPGSGDPSSD
jgi:hypothetical protein